jgi:hypothetical protein
MTYKIRLRRGEHTKRVRVFLGDGSSVMIENVGEVTTLGNGVFNNLTIYTRPAKGDDEEYRALIFAAGQWVAVHYVDAIVHDLKVVKTGGEEPRADK